ncbi:MAG: regulatory protein RecX [Oscillospiraceae bacterium]
MLIKKIGAYRNDASRVIVYFEDRSYITIDALEAERLKIKPGAELDAALIPELSEKSRAAAARTTAARLVGRVMMSRKTLLTKLADRGFNEEEAGSALEWLVSVGAMDDAEYGKMLVGYYRDRGFGVRRIREELRKRGLEREDIDELLEEPVDMQKEIIEYIKKRTYGHEVDRALINKITNALVRRGHSYSDIKEAFHADEIELGDE